MNPDDPLIELIFQWEGDPPAPPKYKRLSEVEEYKKKQIAKGYKLVKESNYDKETAKNLANAKSEEDKAAIAKKDQENRAAAALSAERNAVRKDVGSVPRSFVSGALDGLSSNWLDEATGLVSPETKERMRRNVDIQKSESPNAYAAGQMAGSVGQQALVALGLSRAGVRLPSTPGGQLAYAGVEGAISNLGEAEDVSLEQAPAIAATGAAGGLVGQALGAGVGRASSGALKKLVGNTNLEGALQIDERLAKEALGKQLQEFNASKATGIILKKAAAEEAAKLAATQKLAPKFDFSSLPTPAAEAAAAFEKQFLENKANIKAVAENFQTNYPDPFSVGGAIGSYGGSEATDLQSYQNKLTQALLGGNESIDAANAALAASGPIRVPNIPTQLTPAEEQQKAIIAALDKIIEMNKQAIASEKANVYAQQSSAERAAAEAAARAAKSKLYN
jgi:hypothetical protein